MLFFFIMQYDPHTANILSPNAIWDSHLCLMPAFCDVPLDRRVKVSGWKSENPDEIHFLGYVKESLGGEKKF